MDEKTRETEINEKEKNMIKLISQGYTDKEIAPFFELSISGLRNSLRALLIKTRTVNRSHLVGWAYREGVLKRG